MSEMINVVFKLRNQGNGKILKATVPKSLYERMAAIEARKRPGNWKYVELDKPDEEIDLGLGLVCEKESKVELTKEKSHKKEPQTEGKIKKTN